MKKIMLVSAIVALSSVATAHAQGQRTGGPAVSWIAGTPLESKVVKGQPYSAEVVSESIQTLSDGNRIVQRTTGRVYRDSEGRVRREEDRPSAPPSVSIVDPVTGMGYVLDSANRTARQTP